MKKNTKWIVILSVLIVSLLTYICWHTIVIYQDYKKENSVKNDNITKTTNVENNQTAKTYDKSHVSVGEELTVKVGNKTKALFYLIGEDENTYTLIAKNSLGKSPYYQYDDCNENNSTGCEIKQTELNIQQYLNEKTTNWINVGEVRIPTEDDLEQAEALPNVSFWISNDDDNKENLQIPYYDKDSKKLANDYLYNSRDVIPVIRIIKSYILK